MQRLTKPGNDYLPILTADSIVVDLTDAGNRLRHLGIPAMVLHTIGHFDDYVSDPLDDGGVFTGNLPNPDYAARSAPIWWRPARETSKLPVTASRIPRAWPDCTDLMR